MAATLEQALASQQWTLIQTYWMLRWTGSTYHVVLAPTAGGAPVTTEMFLPEGATEFVVASSVDGSMTTNPRSLANWLAPQPTSSSAPPGPTCEHAPVDFATDQESVEAAGKRRRGLS